MKGELVEEWRKGNLRLDILDLGCKYIMMVNEKMVEKGKDYE